MVDDYEELTWSGFPFAVYDGTAVGMNDDEFGHAIHHETHYLKLVEMQYKYIFHTLIFDQFKGHIEVHK